MKKTILLIYLLFLAPQMLRAQAAISVTSAGNGQPVLLLPGFATPGEVWKQTASALPRYQVHLVTYAGFGGVQPVEMPWYDKIKTDLIQYIQSNKLRDLVIIGHSMGGNLALDLADSLPDHVAKIIIADALACMREVMMPGVPAEALGYGGPFIDQMMAMDDVAQSSYLDQMTQGMISKPADQAMVKAWMKAADRKTFVLGYVDLLKLDNRPILPSIKAPVLLMVAGQPYGPGALDTMKKQYEGLEKKEFAFAAESKHYLMLDQPEWFTDTILSFLEK
jgi:pimeloyl-ACP methyl ester carboxylesterase